MAFTINYDINSLIGSNPITDRQGLGIGNFYDKNIPPEIAEDVRRSNLSYDDYLQRLREQRELLESQRLNQEKEAFEREAARKAQERFTPINNKGEEVYSPVYEIESSELLPSTKAQTDSQKVENHRAGKLSDPRYQYDIDNKSYNYLLQKYGKDTANYAKERNIAKVKMANTLTSEVDPNTTLLSDDIKAPYTGIIGGFAGIKDSIINAGIKAFNEGQEEIEKLSKANENTIARSRWLASITGTKYEDLHEFNLYMREVWEQTYDYKYEQILAETGSKKIAKQEADKEASQFQNDLTFLSKEWFLHGFGEQVPQILIAIVLGDKGISLVSKLSSLGITGRKLAQAERIIQQINKDKKLLSAKKRADLTAEELKRGTQLEGRLGQVDKFLKNRAIANRGTPLPFGINALERQVARRNMWAGSAGAGLGFGLEQGGDDATTTLVYGWQQYQGLSDEQKQELFATEPMQRLAQQNHELSQDDLMVLALKKASSSAFWKSFLTTGLTTALGQNFLTMAFKPSNITKGLSNKQKLALGFGGMPEQYIEEVSQEITSNIVPYAEANKATGYDLYKSDTPYNPYGSALSNSLLAGVMSSPGVISAGKEIITDRKSPDYKIRKTIEKQDKEFTNDSEILNKEFEELKQIKLFDNTIQFIEKFQQTFNENLEKGQQTKTSSIGGFIKTITNSAEITADALTMLNNLPDIEKNKPENQEKIKDLEERLNYLDTVFNEFFNNFQQEFLNIKNQSDNVKQNISDKNKEISDLYTQLNQLENEFNSGSITQDIFDTQLQQLNTLINNKESERKSLQDTEDTLSNNSQLFLDKFENSEIFNLIEKSLNITSKRVSNASNVSDYHFSSIPTVSYSSTNLINNINNSSSEEEAYIAFIGWIKGFRKNTLEKLKSKNTYNLKDFENLLNDLENISKSLQDKGYSNDFVEFFKSSIQHIISEAQNNKILYKVDNNGNFSTTSALGVSISKFFTGKQSLNDESKTLPSIFEIGYTLLNPRTRFLGIRNAQRFLVSQSNKINAIEKIVDDFANYDKTKPIQVGEDNKGNPLYLLKNQQTTSNTKNRNIVSFEDEGKAISYLATLELDYKIANDFLSNLINNPKDIIANKQDSSSSSGSNTQGNQTQGSNTQPITNTQPVNTQPQPQPKNLNQNKKGNKQTQSKQKEKQQQRRIKDFDNKVVKEQDENTRTKNWKILVADKELAQLNPPKKVSSDYQSGQGFIEYTIEFNQERPANGDSIETKLKEKFGDFINIKWEQKQSQSQQQNQNVSSNQNLKQNNNTPQQQSTSPNTGSKKKIIKNTRKPNNKVINSKKDKVENIQDRDFVVRDFGQLKEDWVKERLDNGKTNEEIIQEIYDNFDLNRYTSEQLNYLDEHLENELARIKKELNYQDNQNNVEENNQTQEVVKEQTSTEPEKSDREKLVDSYVDSVFVGEAFNTPRRLLKESLYHNENSQKSWEDLFKGVPDKNNKIAKQTLLGLGVPENITRKDGVLTLTFNKDPKEIKTSNKNINQKQAEKLLEQLLNEPVKIEVARRQENKVENKSTETKPSEKPKPVQSELPLDTGSKQATEKQPSNVDSEKTSQKTEIENTNNEPTKEEVEDNSDSKKIDKQEEIKENEQEEISDKDVEEDDEILFPQEFDNIKEEGYSQEKVLEYLDKDEINQLKEKGYKVLTLPKLMVKDKDGNVKNTPFIFNSLTDNSLAKDTDNHIKHRVVEATDAFLNKDKEKILKTLKNTFIDKRYTQEEFNNDLRSLVNYGLLEVVRIVEKVKNPETEEEKYRELYKVIKVIQKKDLIIKNEDGSYNYEKSLQKLRANRQFSLTLYFNGINLFNTNNIVENNLKSIGEKYDVYNLFIHLNAFATDNNNIENIKKIVKFLNENLTQSQIDNLVSKENIDNTKEYLNNLINIIKNLNDYFASNENVVLGDKEFSEFFGNVSEYLDSFNSFTSLAKRFNNKPIIDASIILGMALATIEINQDLSTFGQSSEETFRDWIAENYGSDTNITIENQSPEIISSITDGITQFKINENPENISYIGSSQQQIITLAGYKLLNRLGIKFRNDLEDNVIQTITNGLAIELLTFMQNKSLIQKFKLSIANNEGKVLHQGFYINSIFNIQKNIPLIDNLKYTQVNKSLHLWSELNKQQSKNKKEPIYLTYELSNPSSATSGIIINDETDIIESGDLNKTIDKNKNAFVFVRKIANRYPTRQNIVFVEPTAQDVLPYISHIEKREVKIKDENGNIFNEIRDVYIIPNNIQIITSEKLIKDYVEPLINFDNKYNTFLVNSISLQGLTNSEIAKAIFPENNSNEKEYIAVKSSPNSLKEAKQLGLKDASSKDVSDNLYRNSAPKEVIEALNHANETSYELAQEMVNILDNPFGVEIIYKLNNYQKLDEKNIENIFSSRYRESVLSRNNGIDRSIQKAKQLIKQARDISGSENISDVDFYINHKLTENQRIMQTAPENPQSNKIIREILKVKNNDLSNLNNEQLDKMFADISQVVNLDEVGFDKNQLKSLLKNSQGIIEVFDFTEGKNTRTIIDLIRRISIAGKDEKAILTNFAYALAQALGIKLEKKTEESIFNELLDFYIDNEKFLNDILQDIYNLTTDKNYKPNLDLYTQLNLMFDTSYKGGKNGTMRSFSALVALSQFSHSKNGSKVKLNLYIEADGLSNFMSNLIRQFGLGFSPEYLSIQEKIGSGSIATILDIFRKKDIKIDEKILKNSLTDKEREQLLNSLQGTRSIFENRDIADTYENLSKILSQQLLQSFNYLKIFNDKNILDYLYYLYKDLEILDIEVADINSFYDLPLSKILNNHNLKKLSNSLTENGTAKIKNKELLNFLEYDQNRKNLKDFIDSLELLNKINLLYVLDGSIEPLKKNQNENVYLSFWVNDFLTTPISEINNIPLNLLHSKISRNISKIILTPAGYGGRTTGISNQLFIDISKNFHYKIDNVIKADLILNLIEDMDKFEIEYKNNKDELENLIANKNNVQDTKKLNLEIEKLKQSITQFEEYKQLIETFLINNGIEKRLSDISYDYDNVQNYITQIENIKETNSKFCEMFLQQFNLDISFKPKNKKDNTFYNIKNNLANIFYNNREKIASDIKYIFGTFFDDVIQNKAYKEIFSSASHTISLDSANISIFVYELEKNINTFIEQRNKQYTDLNDPRRFDFISSKDLDKILNNILSNPSIATAFSGNLNLVKSLIKEGHSVIVNEKHTFENKPSQYSAGSFFPSLSSNPNKVGIFTADIQFRLNTYFAGGAKNLTNTLVSTESKVQAIISKINRILGIGSLNVYDGIDAIYSLAPLYSTLANLLYNEIHQQTNIMESFFHRYNRSNMYEYLPNSSDITNIIKNSSIFEQDNEKFTTYNVNREQLVKLKVLVDLLKVGDIEKLSSIFNTDFISLLFKRKDLESLSKYLNDAEKEFRLDFNNNDTFQIYNDLLINILENLNKDSSNINDLMLQLYNSVLEDFREKASIHYAREQIEKKYLTYIINQYAGSGNGIITNVSELFKDKGVLQRFINFDNEHTISNIIIDREDLNIKNYYNKLSIYEKLSLFLNSDPEIVNEFNTFKNQKVSELMLNSKKTEEQINLTKTSLNDIIQEIQAKQGSSKIDIYDLLEEMLKYFNNNNKTFYSISSKVILSNGLALLKAIEKSDKSSKKGNILKLYTNYDEFKRDAEKLLGKSLRNDVDNIDGLYVSNIGIFINMKKANPFKALNHEIVHMIFDTFLNINYLSKNDILNSNLEYILKNTDGEAKKILKNFRAIGFNIEQLAIQFAKDFALDERVVKLLNDLESMKLSDKENYIKNLLGKTDSLEEISILSNLATAIQYVFNTKEGRNNTSQEIKKEVISEFLAYALTEESLLNKLAYLSPKNLEKEYNKLYDIKNNELVKKGEESNKSNNPFIVLKSLASKAKTLLFKIREKLAQLIFGSEYKKENIEQNDFLNSSLANLLGSLQSITETKIKETEIFSDYFNLPTNTPNIFYSATNQINSIEHQSYLNNLYNDFKNITNFENKVNSKLLAQDLFNKTIEYNKNINNIRNLRALNIPISKQEEDMFYLMSGVYELALKNENPTIYRKLTQILNKANKEFSKNEVFTTEQLKNIFLISDSKSPIGKINLASTFALITVIEPIKREFSKVLNIDEINTNSKNLLNSFINNNLRNTFKSDEIEKIAYQSLHLDIAKSLDFEKTKQIMQENSNYALLRENFAINVIGKIGNTNIPKGLISFLQNGVEEFVLGSINKFTYNAPEQPLGKWIQNYINKSAIKNGGELTKFGVFLRWILQARENTQYIYNTKAKLSANIERIRENYRVVISSYLEKLFKENTFNEQTNKIIHNNILKTRLDRLYSAEPDNIKSLNNLTEFLTNDHKRNQRIKQIHRELERVAQGFEFLEDTYGITPQTIVNFIKWQSMGLAELMITGSADSLIPSSKYTDILPNTKAISSLNNLIYYYHQQQIQKSNLSSEIKEKKEEILNDLFEPDISSDRIQVFKPIVDELVSLYTLKLSNQEDLNSLSELINEQPKAIQNILNSVKNLEETKEEKFSHSLLGYDGYIHTNNINSNIDIQLIPLKIYDSKSQQFKDNNKIQELEQLGYSVYQKIKTDDISKNNEYAVMVSYTSIKEKFQSGILFLTEETVNGASVKTGKNIKEVSEFYETIERDIYYSDNYDTLEDTLNIDAYLQKYEEGLNNFNKSGQSHFNSIINTNIDSRGLGVYYKISLPSQILENIRPVKDIGLKSIGNYNARLFEENLVNLNNIENINNLNKLYEEDKYRNKNQYFQVIGKETREGSGKYRLYIDIPKTKKNKKFLNNLYHLINSLPKETIEYIKDVGVWLNRTELDNILGYNHLSILDLYTRKQKLPKNIKENLLSFLNIFGNQKIKNYLYKFEKFIQEQVSFSKDIILNRSIKVAISNSISNILHLSSLNITPKDIQIYGKEGLLNIIQYQKDYSEFIQLTYKLKIENLNQEEREKVIIRQKLLAKNIKENPLKLLIDNGLFSNIATEIYFENSLLNSTQQDQTVLQEELNKLFPNNKISNIIWGNKNKIINEILINKNSKTHNFMTNLLNYGDFIAKYILIKHLIEDKKFTPQQAINVAREEFVNYTMNRGATFDYLNSMGLTWFASYALGIQKVIWRRLRTNFLGTLGAYLAPNYVPNPFNLIETTAQQNIFDKNWLYTVNPTNTFQGYESHYLMKVWDMIFKD